MQLHFPEEVQTAAAVPEKGLSGRFIKHSDCRRGQTASGQKPAGTNVPAYFFGFPDTPDPPGLRGRPEVLRDAVYIPSMMCRISTSV